MLSDHDILAAIKTGELGVAPFEPAMLRPAGISLRLGHQILVPLPGEVIDLRGQSSDIDYDEIQMSDAKPYVLQPQGFVLGHTFESISIGRHLGLLIEGRSTVARLGLSIVQAAMIVDTGHHDRPVTLEIYNAGPRAVALYPGLSVARAVVFRLSSETDRAYDEYARHAHQKTGAGRPLPRATSE